MEADKRNENLQKFWSQVIMERVNIAKNEIMQSQKKNGHYCANSNRFYCDKFGSAYFTRR